MLGLGMRYTGVFSLWEQIILSIYTLLKAMGNLICICWESYLLGSRRICDWLSRGLQNTKTHGHILNEVLFHFSWLLCGFFFLWGSICEMWLEYLVL